MPRFRSHSAPLASKSPEPRQAARRLLVLFVSVSLAGESICSGTADAADEPAARTTQDDDKLAGHVLSILKRNCHGCHGEGGSDEGGLNYVLNLRRLVATRKVAPGDVKASPMLQRILKRDMPPEDSKTHPSDAEIDLLTRWINTGAPAGPQAEGRRFITANSMHQFVLDDLKAAAGRERRFLRYFTITHLYNAGFSDGELETVRLALAKLINSLSWQRELVRPTPIDPKATVFRIDLRDVRWSVATWDRILSASPYATEPASALLSSCAKLSESRLPMARADWFVATASRPPLYHDVLEMPQSLSGLETQLRIKFRQNIEQDRAARAGFTRSGISTHPRLIERHRTSDGSCWVSHDFSGSTGRSNFFRLPLDFQAAAGEVIFSLPNGMHGYLIVDSAGRRIDTAPIQIVKDVEQPGGTVVNGISCMRCHAAGIIPKHDEVRRTILANEDAFKDQIESVKALYPPDDEFQKLIEEDRNRFQSGLKKLGISRFSAKGEPVFNTARRFRETLDLRQASAELGMQPNRLMALLKKNSNLQRSLGVLRVPGGTISRDAFNEAFRVVTRGVNRRIPIARTHVRPAVSEAISGNIPAPEDYKVEVELPESSVNVRTGGGGRFLFIELAKAGRLAVFDVATRKIVHEINIPDGGVKFAAGRDHLMLVRPGQQMLERWSLKTFQREKVAPIRGAAVLSAVMGCNSLGPLLLWSGGPSVLWDVEKMQPMKIEGKVMGGGTRWDFQLRVSADGQCFTGWLGGISPSSFGVMRLQGKKATSAEFGGGSHNGRWSQPSADGHLFFTYVKGPEMFSRDLKRIGGSWPASTVFLPCVDPRFFLAIHDPKNTRVSICTAGDQRIIHVVSGIENMMSSRIPGRWGNHGGEPRVSFVPSLNALVTLPANNRIVVRHLNLEAALRESNKKHLFVVSLPKTLAVPRKVYQYRIDARSQEGGVRYKLESAPKGMTVSSSGELRWTVPVSAVGTTSRVIVQIGDASDQEFFHTFSVTVAK